MSQLEIVDSLGAVGYEGNLICENSFSEAINEGFKNEDLRNLVIWLANEISEIAKMEEKITQDSDVNSFLIELSGFLKELQCCYEVFTSDGNINNKLQSLESRFLLLEFLVGELMTQKMLLVCQKPKNKSSVITITETSTAAALKDISITLSLGKPPDNISPEMLFTKISTRLDETLKTVPNSEKRIGNPLFIPKKPLNDAQWNKLAKIQAALEEEYNLRRKMLITRLDVTIQSFKWSDKLKGKEKDINERYSNRSQVLDKLQYGGQRTDIASLLAARDKLAIIEKTSSANVRKNTKSKLQRHIIGKVPDRGGRTLENQQPAPEMPSWQKRQPGNDSRGGGRGGNRGNFNQNRGQSTHFGAPSQGFPAEHYNQQKAYNPSNQQQSGDNNYQGNQSRGGGSRVQGGWNQGGDNNQRGRGRGGRW